MFNRILGVLTTHNTYVLVYTDVPILVSAWKNLELFTTNCKEGDTMGCCYFPGHICPHLKFATSIYCYLHSKRNKHYFLESKFLVYLLSFAMKQITPKPSSLKQQIFFVSQLSGSGIQKQLSRVIMAWNLS